MQFDNVVTTLLSFHHTQWSPTTSSYASLNSPRSSFDMLDLDFICTSPMWSSLSVHIVGMSIAVNNNINFTEAYQLSKVRFPIPSLHCSTKFETTRTVKSFPGVHQLLSHQNRELYDTGIHPNLPRQSFYIQTGHFCYASFTWQSAYQSMVSFVHLLHNFDANNQTVSMRHY